VEDEIAGATFWAARAQEEEEERVKKGSEMRRCWWSMKLERRSSGDS
jgi:hypothetical protein